MIAHVKTFIFVSLLSTAAVAEKAACGIESIKDGKELGYPPIAKAAHVTGDVIFLASFRKDGSVSDVSILSGPEMLKAPVIEYVRAWRANEYGGSRECPFVITFRLNEDDKVGVKRLDIQHLAIYGQAPCLCDPAAELHTRRHWYWPF